MDRSLEKSRRPQLVLKIPTDENICLLNENPCSSCDTPSYPNFTPTKLIFANNNSPHKADSQSSDKLLSTSKFFQGANSQDYICKMLTLSDRNVKGSPKSPKGNIATSKLPDKETLYISEELGEISPFNDGLWQQKCIQESEQITSLSTVGQTSILGKRSDDESNDFTDFCEQMSMNDLFAETKEFNQDLQSTKPNLHKLKLTKCLGIYDYINCFL